MKYEFRIVISLLLGLFSVTHPISQQTAFGLAIATSCVGGYITYKSCENFWIITPPVIGCGMYLSYTFFHQFTPAGRIDRAKNILYIIRKSTLVSESFKTKENIIDSIKTIYIMSEWPLISAYNDLSSLISNAKLGIGLAIAAKQEDFTYKDIGTDIVDELSIVINNMAGIIKLIRDSADYLKQLELYKEEKRREKELMAMQSQANAQWSQANAQWNQAHSQYR